LLEWSNQKPTEKGGTVLDKLMRRGTKKGKNPNGRIGGRLFFQVWRRATRSDFGGGKTKRREKTLRGSGGEKGRGREVKKTAYGEERRKGEWGEVWKRYRTGRVGSHL